MKLVINNPEPEDMPDVDWEVLVRTAVSRNHPGRDCPCPLCLIMYPE